MLTFVFQTVNVLAMVLIALGLRFRRDRRRHVRLMTAALVTDLLLVIAVELTRGAVEKAFATSRTVVIVHSSLSTGVLVLWAVQAVSGVRILRGRPALPVHRRTAAAFVACRLGSFATSFLVL